MVRIQSTMSVLSLIMLLLSPGIFAFEVQSDPGCLVEIHAVCPTIVTDIRYATNNNIMHRAVYTSAKCCVRKEVGRALQAIQKELAKQGLGLKIWDGFRSLSAQQALWAICPDERYVANPKKGGRHTRGTAVDVTLIDLKTGLELEMPTPFDELSQRAWRSYAGPDISPVAIRNRKTLTTSMEKHGFKGLETEWWHFDYIGWQDFPVLDLDVALVH